MTLLTNVISESNAEARPLIACWKWSVAAVGSFAKYTIKQAAAAQSAYFLGKTASRNASSR
jgi:hypothetical protein